MLSRVCFLALLSLSFASCQLLATSEVTDHPVVQQPGAELNRSAAQSGAEPHLESLLHWAIQNADAEELARLAAASALPAGEERAATGGSKAWTLEELVEKRAKVRSAMDYLEALPTAGDLVKAALVQLADGPSVEQRVAALEALLDLSAELDTANDFSGLGALQPLLAALTGPEEPVRALAAHVLGRAAANNPPFHAHVLPLGAVSLLLERAEQDSESVQAKALYALSALARLPGPGQEAFLEAGGAHVLRRLLLGRAPGGTSPGLRKKALVLLTDLASAPLAAAGPLARASRAELRDPALLGVVAELAASPDNDLAEKALRAMLVYLEADSPAAAAAAAAALARGGAGAALAELRGRFEVGSEEDAGSYQAELVGLVDEVAQALAGVVMGGAWDGEL